MTELPDNCVHPEVDRIYCADCEKLLPTLPAESIDLIVTDPPYGWNFMGKDWDKALVPKKVWAECLRVLKPGAFAFIMSGPRLVYGADLKPRSERGNYDATMGRFPANLLVSNSVLDSEDAAFFRFFDLDAWWSRKLKELPEGVQRTFPFLIVPKATRTERNKGLESCQTRLMGRSGGAQQTLKAGGSEYLQNHIGFNRISQVMNPHPTIKPIKLMSYLITLGSRPGDLVLDPFLGSGSTCIGAVLLNRHYIGIEINPEYCSIAEKRVKWWEKTRSS